MHECDSMISVLCCLSATVKPDAIFHIASHANVVHLITPVRDEHHGNANLLEAEAAGIDPVIQFCSTSEVYGQVDPKMFL